MSAVVVRYRVKAGQAEVNAALVKMLGYDSAEQLLEINLAALYAEPAERTKLIELLQRPNPDPAAELLDALGIDRAAVHAQLLES